MAESMTYKNGNTLIEINEGIKHRYVPDNQVPCPEYPESVYLKITNRCDVYPLCPACYEESGSNGIHAALLKFPLFKSFLPGMELVIDGGDPMSHPQLEEFLIEMTHRRLICNLTVHWKSFLEHFDKLKYWARLKLIHKLGISINEIVPCEVMEKLEEFPSAVVHTIVGIADETVFRQTMDRGFDIMLNGYKNFGRGIIYKNYYAMDIYSRTSWVKDRLNCFPEHYRTVSFDSSAIEQLEPKTTLRLDMYQKVYMEDNKPFTMYIDLVKNEFAKSSTSPKMPIESSEIKELFAKVRKQTILQELENEENYLQQHS